MIWAICAAAVVALSAGGMAYAARRAKRRHPPQLVAPDLARRVVAAARAFASAPSWQAASAPGAPATAAAIEAALIGADLERALAAAEGSLAADPDAAAPRVWLAWVLLAQAQPTAALAQLAEAARRPGEGTALEIYLRARAEHLAFEHASGAVGALPPLVTTGDLAVVTLARGRGSPTWLTGSTEVQLSAAQVRAAVGGHREVTARCLTGALDALAAAPGFADAGYLVARLAVKAGAVAAAREMFEILAPRMAGRPDADAFARDRSDLDDPSRAVTAAKQKPVPAGARRSTRLKVLP